MPAEELEKTTDIDPDAPDAGVQADRFPGSAQPACDVLQLHCPEYHFSDEEKLQRQYGYPDYENHKRYHEEYKRIVAGILNEFEQGGATVALVSKTNQAIAGWLLNHIKKEDVKVAAHIRSKCQD